MASVAVDLLCRTDPYGQFPSTMEIDGTSNAHSTADR